MDHNNFVFFWKKDATNGIFSNWSEHTIVENGITYNTAEHYLMYHKAILFNDTVIAKKILLANGPLSVKNLGRQVSGYNDETWHKHRENIMYNALKLKTEQNDDVREALLATENKIIAEASPYDKIWGIGYEQFNNHALNQSKWGLNLLGRSWMKLRDVISN
jgi:ribA/ribD-fused uncharacterized protein